MFVTVGTEEVGIKVEEAIDTTGEIAEAITFPEIKTTVR